MPAPAKRGRLRLDIARKRYGRLRALRVVRVDPKLGAIWRCACDCGGSRDVAAGRLQSGSPHECEECAGARDKTVHGRSERHDALRREALERAAKVYKDYVEGRMSYGALAAKYHVSRARVGQIIQWYETQLQRRQQ